MSTSRRKDKKRGKGSKDPPPSATPNHGDSADSGSCSNGIMASKGTVPTTTTIAAATTTTKELSSNNHTALVLQQQQKPQPTLSCRSQDGRLFAVELDVFKQWKMMLRVFFGGNSSSSGGAGGGLCFETDAPQTTFEFPVLLRSEILEKIIDWCRHHRGLKEPVVRENPLTGERIWFKLNDYERRFFDVPVQELSDLISAGNYLDIKALYLYGCQSMAALINHKTPEQIRELLGLEDDLTEIEKMEIRAENELIRREEMARRSAIALFHSAAAQRGKKKGGGGWR